MSPFRGLIYDTARVGSLAALTAPPYDTVDATLRRRLQESSPYNIVHLDLSDPWPDDDANSNQYTRAASLLQSWRARTVLRRLPRPAFYPYEMRFRYGGAPRSVRGLICEVQVEPWGGSILPHEATMPGPIADRLQLVRELRTDLSAIYAIFSGPRPAFGSFLDDWAGRPPALSVTDEAGVEHRMWVAEGHAQGLPEDESFMIADGHHRYAVALSFREEMRAAHGPGPWDRLMMFVVDAGTQRPPVLPIHRVALHAEPPPAAERVRDLAELVAALDDERVTYGIVRRDGDAIVHELGRLAGSPPTVCALTERVQALADPRNVRFTHDAAEAEALVRSGAAAIAYLLPPTSAARIRSVVEAGRRLPQKSTYFWPKPRTGMVLRPLD